jgi:hypothetical protein
MTKKILLAVGLDKAQAEWLERKREQGYNKGSIIRLLVNECMSREETNANPVRVKDWRKDKEEHVTFLETINAQIKDSIEENKEANAVADSKKAETKTEENQEEKEAEWFPIDGNNMDIEEAVAEIAASDDLNELESKRYKAMDYCFKNLKHIGPETAFTLGIYKGNMLQYIERNKALNEQS